MVAANRMLRGEVQARARRLTAAEDAAFALAPDGTLAWAGEPVARLVAATARLPPGSSCARWISWKARRATGSSGGCERFVRDAIARVMAPLETALASPLEARARGLVFRLGEGLGSLDAEPVRPLIGELDPADRKALARLGIRFGTETIYFDRLLKPAAVALRAMLWTIHEGAGPLAVPPPGRVSVARDGEPAAYFDALGYRPVGARAIRADRLEELAVALRTRARDGRFVLDGALAALVGAPMVELPGIVAALGYRGVVEDGVTSFVARKRPPRRKEARMAPPAPAPSADHPFAKLGALRGRG